MGISVQDLDQELKTAGIPIHGVANADNTREGLRIDFMDEATEEQRVQADALVVDYISRNPE